MKPRVSIITPFLNAEAHLAEAIASVRAQTCPDWELLLVDDGSHDGSSAIADRAAQKDSRIRSLRRGADRPAGAAAARNLGLKAARGEFITFLDADDRFTADKLETQLELMARHPGAMMIYGPTLWWHPEDARLNWTENMRSLAGRLHAPPRLLDKVVLTLRGPVPCICAVLIRRGAFDLVGGFEERFRLYEDQTLWVKIMARYPIYVSDHVTAMYRQHGGSTSAASEREGDYDRLGPHPARQAFLDWAGEYLLALERDNPSTKRALRLARAMLSGDRSKLTIAEKAVLWGHWAEDRARAARRKLNRLATIIRISQVDRKNPRSAHASRQNGDG